LGEPSFETYLSAVSYTNTAMLELKMPKNSYLSSYPAGNLVELPDREQAIFEFPFARWPDLELFYLSSLRHEWVRSTFKEDSPSDLFLSALAFLVGPIALFLLGHVHRQLGEGAINLFRRRPKRRRAGF
jgi:hypothetical protein